MKASFGTGRQRIETSDKRMSEATPLLRVVYNDDGRPTGAILTRLISAQVVLARALGRPNVLNAIGCLELVS